MGISLSRNDNNKIVINEKHNENFVKKKIGRKNSTLFHQGEKCQPLKSKQPLLPPNGCEDKTMAVSDSHVVNSRKTDESTQIPVVSRDEKKPKSINSKKPILPPSKDEPWDGTLMNVRDTSKMLKYYYSASKTPERSSSPVYAEPMIKKVKQNLPGSSIDMLTKAQIDSDIKERRLLHEYAEVDDATIECIGEDKRHYYHSLEAPTDKQVCAKSKGRTLDTIHEERVQHHHHSLEAPTDHGIVNDASDSKDHGFRVTCKLERHYYHSLEAPVGTNMVNDAPESKD